MIVGTAWFVNKAAAIRYYREYEFNNAESAVERKLAEGQIHIGQPPLKSGEALLLIDNGTRYAIDDGE